VIPVRAKIKQDRKPRMLQASLKTTAPVQPMFVVMQTLQYESNGSAVWTLCVWQITVDDASQRRAQPEAVMNSL
jgi:hypothetical protein